MGLYTHSFATIAGVAAEAADPLAKIAEVFGVRWELLFAQVINFCLVAYVLYRFALKPVLRTVEERQKKISEGLQYAEEMKLQLAEAEKQRLSIVQMAQVEAHQLFERVKKDGETYLQTQKEEAERKTEQMFQQAQVSIENERKKMYAEVRSEVTTLVIDTTERLLKNSLTEKDKVALNQRAIDALEETQRMS